jgi:hypothetical protein
MTTTTSPARPVKRQQPGKIKIAPSLFEALRDLAAEENYDLPTLVTLLINTGLDHRRRRA